MKTFIEKRAEKGTMFSGMGSSTWPTSTRTRADGQHGNPQSNNGNRITRQVQAQIDHGRYRRRQSRKEQVETNFVRSRMCP